MTAAPPADAITVAALWPVAFPPGTRLAGGAGGLQRTVDWVVSLRATVPLFADLAPGYLALASSASARTIDPLFSVSRLIHELAGIGAAGLLVDEPVTSTDAAPADALNLPVFVVPTNTDLRSLEREILRALVDREGQALKRASEARERYRGLLSSGGLEAVLRDLAVTWDARVVVEDARGAVIAAHDGRGGPSRLTAVICPAGRNLGRLVVGSASPLTSFAIEPALQAAAEVCGLEMLRREARQEAEDALAADIISEVQSPSADLSLVRARLDRLGFAPEEGRRFLACAVSGRDAADARAIAVALAREFALLGGKHDVRALTGHLGDLGVCLFSCAPSTGGRAIRQWLAAAYQRLPWAPATLGVGRAPDTLAGLRESLAQALAARSLGQRLGGGAIHYYEDLGLERLLANLRDQTELRRFYDETVGLLAAYDRAHSTELVSTLRAFFEQNANASQAARVLSIHRNTLDYRLQRVMEITGLDLADADARLTLQLALKVHLLSPPAADCATCTVK